jgi:cytochrome P450 family 2 subfamily U polypeptide 1
MEVFLMFTSLFQKFTFSNPEGAKKPSLDGVFTSTNAPHPFEVSVTLRCEMPAEERD